MGFLPDSIGDNLHRLVIGNIRNFLHQCFHILNFQGQLLQLLFLRRQLLLLLHQDIVLFLQIRPPTIGRLLLQMHPMLAADVKEQRAAYCIKCLLAVVVFALGLTRIRQLKAQFLQRLFLLGAQFPIPVFAVKHMALMDVGRTLIQMQRPVQNVDMGAKAPFKLLIKFADNERQRTRWNGFFHGANLINAFLRTGLVVFQKIFYGTVALGVPGFLVPGILGIHMVGIMLVVIHPLNFFKAEIRLLWFLPKFRGSESTVAIPVHIFSGSLGINVFAVLHIKPAIIVPGIIGAMLAGASVVPCQFQFSSLHSPLIFPEGEQRRSRQTCGFLRPVIPSMS